MKFKNLKLKLTNEIFEDGAMLDVKGHIAVLEMQGLKINIEGSNCSIESDRSLEDTCINLDTVIRIIEDYTE